MVGYISNGLLTADMRAVSQGLSYMSRSELVRKDKRFAELVKATQDAFAKLDAHVRMCVQETEK